MCDGEQPLPPPLACGCLYPDTVLGAYSDNITGTPGNCKIPGGVVEFVRCSLADALSCFSYVVRTYTLIGGNPEEGWEYSEPEVDSSTALLACLTQPWTYTTGAGITFTEWYDFYCWKAGPVTYTNDCCGLQPGFVDCATTPNLNWHTITSSGSLYYMVIEKNTFQHGGGGLLTKQCAEYLWACSVVDIDNFCDPDQTHPCTQIIEGSSPYWFLNSASGGPGGLGFNFDGPVRTPPYGPCGSYQTGDFNSGDATVIVRGFDTPCGPPANTWLICNKAAAGIPGQETESRPNPLTATCTPFLREWSWAGGVAASAYWTLSG